MCLKPWISRSSAWLKFQNYIRSFLRSNFIKQKSLINIHKHMNLEPKLFTKKPTKRKLGADVSTLSIIFPLDPSFTKTWARRNSTWRPAMQLTRFAVNPHLPPVVNTTGPKLPRPRVVEIAQDGRRSCQVALKIELVFEPWRCMAHNWGNHSWAYKCSGP